MLRDKYKTETRPAQQKRQRRNVMARNTEVLDDFGITTQIVTTDELCSVLRIVPQALRNILRTHRQELLDAGYSPEDGGWFTREAVMRVALLLRPTTSAVAGQIAEAAGMRYTRITFGGGGAHASRCSAIIDQAVDVAQRVHEECPAELWHDLTKMNRYELQALAVALAAMVPVDEASKNELLGWVAGLADNNDHRAKGGIPSGMAQLIPTKATADGVPPTKLDDFLGGAA
ncbi:hypothetical protein SEA_TAQUITO_56 [Mycobacterium phage Taquito]|uniref:Uncharacterized protein n=2 Tax=Fionnbharthvirus TaxID=2948708 RepID=A0A1D8EQ64_9CAUD|nr:hypothetical protein I5G70_gp77 [Mycobacterium phage Taquito]AOT23176.1 hypothetical protein SEA_TAQUITO_56 [Mycobacterium phage Taquito]ASR87763.1 hypothetical protein WINTERMUTE_56 [Mycobacterium phage Wintermute]